MLRPFTGSAIGMIGAFINLRQTCLLQSILVSHAIPVTDANNRTASVCSVTPKGPT